MISRTATATALAAVLVGGLYASTAGASPTTPPAPIPTPPIAGVLDGSEERGVNRVKQDRVELRTKDLSSVAMFTLTYPEGSVSGWHVHSGIVIAVVEKGAVTRQAGCETETFTVGEAFTEVGPHNVSNAGAGDAVLRITRVYPTGAPARTNVEAPDCDR